MDHSRARAVLRALKSVDQAMVDARLLQGCGQRQTGRAGPNDQHIGSVCLHGGAPFANMR
jgi:hypothetical protein